MGREHSEKTTAAATNRVVNIPSTRRERANALRTRNGSIRYRFLIHIDRNQECSRRDDYVRKIDQQIRQRRDHAPVANSICDDIGSIEKTKEPEVKPCGLLPQKTTK